MDAGLAPNWGYPPQRAEVLSRCRGTVLRFVAVTALGALVTGIGAMWSEGLTLAAAIFGAVFLWALAGGVLGLRDTAQHMRIIPYFRHRVGGTETFLAGRAVAYHFQPLERLALEAGIGPLSAFGFGDDLMGEAVTWHPAAEGLRTVRALRRLLQQHPEALADAAAVARDLQRWEDGLTRAEAQGIEFALLLQFGNSTSALEWERRSGSPF